MFAPLAAVAGALLAAFHLWLLGQQAWTGALDYAATLRWLLAFGVVGGLVALYRRGAPLLGRRATALWVLAAVLHGPALGNDARPVSQLSAETSDVAIQLTGAAIGLALAITLARAIRARRAVLDCVAAAGHLLVAAVTLASFDSRFLPRPPPLA